MSSKNYFSDPERAGLYDKSRPSYHAQALEYYHGQSPKVLYNKSLDVGCGTGQSSKALSLWSHEVVGIDSSQAMLDVAIQDPKIHYRKADAENLPFAEGTFDLVFVASSLHWFEKRKFLGQVSKVLKSQGKFLVYDSFIHEGLDSEFSRTFSSRFPRPFEDVKYAPAELEFFDLKLVKHSTFEFKTSLTIEDVTRYFFNLSNVTAAIDRGESSDNALSEVRKIVSSHASGSPFSFQVLLTEMIKL